LVTIPNGVNLDRFKFAERRPGKNLACVGYLNMRKNPMFLLQCVQKLHYIDPEYRLFFAGPFQDPMLEQYIRHMVDKLKLTDVVSFDGWQEDVNSWLHDKHYIVSASIGESQGMGLLEAMACGLKPVIHNFPGASQIFPSEFLFDISEQFCEQICSGTYDPPRYRRFVEENYPLQDQLSKINETFIRLETEIDLQQTGALFCSASANEISSPIR
jgi:glycosyltransferase involved in cell wall biosynthesis